MKKSLLYIPAVIILLTGAYLLVNDVHNYDYLPYFQRLSAETVLNKFEIFLAGIPPEKRSTVDYDQLLGELNFFQRYFAENILDINPAELGFKGPYYSKQKPGKLIKINSRRLSTTRETGVQYLPEHVFSDYIKMMEKMKKDIGKQLYVDSGYRSPGRQAYLFFYYLVKSNGFSLRENARWIALPGYSEHGHPVNTAIDFTSELGINGFSDNQSAADFANLDEYKWLNQNAKDFNFYLSYPENNKYGVAFEPWHWHWEIVQSPRSKVQSQF